MYLTENEVVRLDKGKRILLNLQPKQFEEEFLELFEVCRA